MLKEDDSAQLENLYQRSKQLIYIFFQKVVDPSLTDAMKMINIDILNPITLSDDIIYNSLEKHHYMFMYHKM